MPQGTNWPLSVSSWHTPEATNALLGVAQNGATKSQIRPRLALPVGGVLCGTASLFRSVRVTGGGGDTSVKRSWVAGGASSFTHFVVPQRCGCPSYPVLSPAGHESRQVNCMR